jgi:TonB-linked SusC/RagA family outer membrane protein
MTTTVSRGATVGWRWMLSLVVVLLALTGSETTAQGTITGRVIDTRTQLPIAGASVQIEGTTRGALAAADGRYRIPNVAAGSHVLIASSIGYASGRQTVSVTANAQVTADFTLQESAISLDELVVTSVAGAERVRSIGNSVTRVNAEQAVALGAPPTVQSLLNARAPGVTINFTTGRVGAGETINIRGRSSIGQGNSPLIYVDGVRINAQDGVGQSSGGFSGQGAGIGGRLNDISPETIESIEIIKGPAAATIYGTEASNGVIQITTKKGAAGAPTFSLQVQQGTMWFRDPEGRIKTNFFRDRTSGEIVTWNGVEEQKAFADSTGGRPLFENGRAQTVTGSISGGVDQVRYFVSSSYQDDTGVEPNNSLKQFSVRANLNLTPSPKLDFGTSVSYIDLRGHLGTDVGASTMLNTVGGHRLLWTASRGFAFGFPPEVSWELWDNQQMVRRFIGSGTVNYNATSWLSQRLLAGVDYTAQDLRGLERFAPPELARYLTPTNALGRIVQNIRNNSRFSLDYSASARARVMESLSATTTAGAQVFRNQVDQSQLGGLGFPGSGVYTVSATATPTTPSQSITINTTVGAYVQEKFGWKDRLFLTGALRVDNNSAFGEDFKWVTYPKVDASWVLSEEPFWTPLQDVLSTFRLRAAYGESGQAPNAFAALQTFSPVQGPGGSNAVTPGGLGNPNLKPERGKEIEAGFEAELFNRFSIDFTYFNKRTEDQIVNQAVAPSSGFPGSIPLNLARVDNHGFELMTTFDALRRDNLRWDITASLARVKDEIKDVGIAVGAITSIGNYNRVGFPIGGWFAKKVVSADRNPTTNLATNVMCDNGEGSAVACASAPFVFIGTTTPTYSGAISNTFTILRRLRLYALVDYQGGNVLFNANDHLRCTGGFGGGLCEANYFPERFDPVHLAHHVGTAAAQGLIGEYLEDASYVKLREVSLTYTVPERWIGGLDFASVGIVARELKTWTDYSGIDPDVSFTNDQAVTPQLSRVTVIFNVRF